MVKGTGLRLLIGLLVLAGAAKAATSLPGLDGPEKLFLASATVPAAQAAGSTGAQGADAMPVKSSGCQTPDELLQSVQQERALIDKQKTALDDRAAKLDLAKQELTVQTKRLSELKDTVEALLKKANAAHNDDLDRLVKLYQAMKPVDAAGILNNMDIEVTVMVLANMNERNAAPIMAKMSPTRVQAVSKIILERSKLPGDQNAVSIQMN